MIERNRHPSGRIGNMCFGVASVLDGFVRFVSLGFLHTRLTVNVSRWQVKTAIKRMRPKV